MKNSKKKGNKTPGVRLRTKAIFSRSFAGGCRCAVSNCGTYVEDGVCEHGHQQIPEPKK